MNKRIGLMANRALQELDKTNKTAELALSGKMTLFQLKRQMVRSNRALDMAEREQKQYRKLGR